MAILAGDALLTLAFEVLTRTGYGLGSAVLIGPDTLARAHAAGMRPNDCLSNNDGHGFFVRW